MKEIYIPSGETENIRSLVRYRHSLGEELTAVAPKSRKTVHKIDDIIIAICPTPPMPTM